MGSTTEIVLYALLGLGWVGAAAWVVSWLATYASLSARHKFLNDVTEEIEK